MAQTLYPNPSAALFSTVTDTSQQVTLNPHKRYLLVSTVPYYIAQGTNPVATAGAGSMLWPALTPLPVMGGRGKLALLRQGGANGSATIVEADSI